MILVAKRIQAFFHKLNSCLLDVCLDNKAKNEAHLGKTMQFSYYFHLIYSALWSMVGRRELWVFFLFCFFKVMQHSAWYKGIHSVQFENNKCTTAKQCDLFFPPMNIAPYKNRNKPLSGEEDRERDESATTEQHSKKDLQTTKITDAEIEDIRLQLLVCRSHQTKANWRRETVQNRV